MIGDDAAALSAMQARTPRRLGYTPQWLLATRDQDIGDGDSPARTAIKRVTRLNQRCRTHFRQNKEEDSCDKRRILRRFPNSPRTSCCFFLISVAKLFRP